jgi:hypothetical protein
MHVILLPYPITTGLLWFKTNPLPHIIVGGNCGQGIKLSTCLSSLFDSVCKAGSKPLHETPLGESERFCSEKMINQAGQAETLFKPIKPSKQLSLLLYRYVSNCMLLGSLVLCKELKFRYFGKKLKFFFDI